MSSGLPTPTDCCSTCPTSDETGSDIPGPIGPAGADGTNGTNGANAYTTLTAGFTQPAVDANVVIAVVTTSWMAVGQNLFIRGGGDYELISIGSGVAATVKNLGYPNNAAPSAAVSNSSMVTPSGQRGEAGADGSSASNPLTTKGDLFTRDATASARLGVGTDGQVVAYDSLQATGLIPTTILPNTATDNAIPRFDGASGKPAPLQTSLVSITDEGAIQTIGGNARGSRAVDLQTQRTDVTQVASGTRSFIGSGAHNAASGSGAAVCAGQANLASGDASFVGGGETNSAAGEQSAVVGGAENSAGGGNSFIGGGTENSVTTANGSVVAGELNTVSAAYGFIGGGQENIASGDYASVVAGSGNTASASNSAVTGGSNGKADKVGQIAHASGLFSAQGDAQTSELVWRNATTDDTETELFLDGSASRATIAQSFSWIFHIHVVGRDDAGNSAVWEIKGGIKNNAGSTSLIGSVTTTLVATDAAVSASWGVAGSIVTTADDTNDSLKLAVTGLAATNIRWVAHARIVEVKY